mgnify:FL=1
MYKSKEVYNVAMKFIKPVYKTGYGVDNKVYPKIEDVGKECVFCGSFKTYGGTEKNVNGVYSIEDTANVETWYTPKITSDCRIVVLDNGAVYEIIGEPENVEMRNIYLKFKLRRYKGKS